MLVSFFMVSVIQKTISVFVPNVEGPFNNWSREATAQGFSWRSQSVSFLTFDDDDVLVEVYLEQDVCLLDDAIRAIVVPFHVPHESTIEVSGIYEKAERLIHIPEGAYALVFQLGYTGEVNYYPELDIEIKQMWCKLNFVPSELTQPQILRQDADLSPPHPLVMDGEPA